MNLATKSGAFETVRRAFEHLDNWQNIYTGFGTTRDKLTYSEFLGDTPLTDGQLEALYHGDDMAARICDELPDQCLRQGYILTVDGDPEGAKAIVEYLDRLEAREYLVNGHTWGRCFGGSALFVGAVDGQDPSQPLNEQAIRSIDFLNVFDKWELIANSWYSDPSQPQYGNLETFRVMVSTASNALPIITNTIIHESRLILFGGARTSQRQKRQNSGWDHSVLQRVYQVLLLFSQNWQSVAALMSDASQGVFSLRGLIDALASGGSQQILDRLALVDRTRSSGRMIVVDAEGENFERKPTSFAGIPDLIDRTNSRLAAAAGMPVTVLFGTSPAGLNATGESDVRGWYDKIRNVQQHYILPRLRRLVRLAMLARNGPTRGREPAKWEIAFPSLWQLSPTEEADRNQKQAAADAAWIGAQVVTPEEIALSRFQGPEGYSAKTTINTEVRQALIEDDKLAEKLDPPPPPPPLIIAPPKLPPTEEPPTVDEGQS